MSCQIDYAITVNGNSENDGELGNAQPTKLVGVGVIRLQVNLSRRSTDSLTAYDFFCEGFMEIKLHLFAAFGSYLPTNSKGRTATLTVHEGMTIRDLLLQVGIPLADVKLVSANGKQTIMEYRMQKGDTIGIYPPVSGG